MESANDGQDPRKIISDAMNAPEVQLGQNLRSWIEGFLNNFRNTMQAYGIPIETDSLDPMSIIYRFYETLLSTLRPAVLDELHPTSAEVKIIDTIIPASKISSMTIDECRVAEREAIGLINQLYIVQRLSSMNGTGAQISGIVAGTEGEVAGL